MVIKILGKISSKRDFMFTVVQTAIWELQLNIQVIKIEDDTEINVYKIDHTPVLLIDDKPMFEGIVPGITEIKEAIIMSIGK
jgi:hypothetical protein